MWTARQRGSGESKENPPLHEDESNESPAMAEAQRLAPTGSASMAAKRASRNAVVARLVTLLPRLVANGPLPAVRALQDDAFGEVVAGVAPGKSSERPSRSELVVHAFLVHV